MNIRIECPKCKSQYEVSGEHLGKEVDCPKCKTTFTCKNNKIPSSELTPVKQKKKTNGCLVLFAIAFIVFVILCGAGALMDYREKEEIARVNAIKKEEIARANASGRAEITRANTLWSENQKEKAVRLYISSLRYVDEADKPEIYSRIITYRYDNGVKDGATEYCNKAINENIDLQFSRDDLRNLLNNARQAIKERKAKELAEAQAKKEVEKKQQAEKKKAEKKLEAERQEKEEKEKAEQAAKSQALVKANLEAYLAVLKATDVNIVKAVAVERYGDRWTATLTVDNRWHWKLYQIRLQDAQILWQVWARIASPDNLDSARISIVDLNGNEVGGSRILGGSLIWVQK